MRALPGIGLTGFFGLGFDGWDDEMDVNLRLVSALVQANALDLVAANPGSPTNGDIYLLDDTHATNPGEIAIRDDGAWVYVAPQIGWKFYDAAAGFERRSDGTTWPPLADNDPTLADNSEAIIPSQQAVKGYVDAAVAVLGGGGEGAAINGVVSGCGVAYSGAALTFDLSAGSFYIDGDLYSAAAQSVTLDAADPTDPRIDVLYLDDTGDFGKITGTAAASPSQPAVDPTTQLYLTFVLVPAAATTLAGITSEEIYLEGTEWTATTSGSGFTVDSTNNPYAGTKDIEGTAVTAGSYVKFVTGSPISFDGDGNLTLRIRSKATWNNKRWLTIQWYEGGIAKGSPVSLKSGTFGFVSSSTADYQLVVIPKYLFSVPAGTDIDELRVADVGGAIGFYLDNIILQTNGTTTGGGTADSGMTQAAADARYLKLTGGVASGPIEVPDEAYGAGWNASNKTPTQNAVYDKIEAILAAAGSEWGAITGTLTDQSDLVAYVAAQIATAVTGLLDLKGSTDCSANPNYPAASKGDAYIVSVAGKIGGASGETVEVGDFYIASADNAGGTEASVGTSWFVLQANGAIAGALLAANNLSDVASKVAAKDTISVKGADIASAGTTDLSAATGDFVDVTGTTTITALGTAAAGVERVVRFTSILTLTHHATSLILPTGASITTAAGDVARFRSLGSGNWVCVGYSRASGAALLSSSYSGGVQSVPILAAAMTARTTNGAAAGTTETTTNKVMLATLDFDASTDEFAQFMFPMPKSWNEGTITAQFIWTAASGSGDVIWGIQGVAVSEADALDAAFGTAQTVTDTLTTAEDNHTTSFTSAVTIGGSPAEGDLVCFQVYRDANAGGDTLAVDAKLIGIRLNFTTNAADDS